VTIVSHVVIFGILTTTHLYHVSSLLLIAHSVVHSQIRNDMCSFKIVLNNSVNSVHFLLSFTYYLWFSTIVLSVFKTLKSDHASGRPWSLFLFSYISKGFMCLIPVLVHSLSAYLAPGLQKYYFWHARTLRLSVYLLWLFSGYVNPATLIVVTSQSRWSIYLVRVYSRFIPRIWSTKISHLSITFAHLALDSLWYPTGYIWLLSSHLA